MLRLARIDAHANVNLALSLLSSLAIAAAGATYGPSAANALDLDEVTVVTLSRDGSWGVATATSLGPAIAAAIRDCRATAAMPSDCGAQFATTRGGWVVAMLCGDHKILVTAATREGTEEVALVRETKLSQLHTMGVPPCRRVLTVKPHGFVVPAQAPAGHQIDAQREKGQLRRRTWRLCHARPPHQMLRSLRAARGHRDSISRQSSDLSSQQRGMP